MDKEFLIFTLGLIISIIMGIITMQIRMLRKLTIEELCKAVILCSVSWFLAFIVIKIILLPSMKLPIENI